MLLSTITPKMRDSPSASCSAMSCATGTWFSGFFWLLPCEQSIISRQASAAWPASKQAAFTLSRS